MKRKMHYHVQPRETLPPRSEQVQAEIENFLQALDSYPARVAKDPGLSFHQYLGSFFTAAHDHRRDHRSRRQ
jgi:hypothetical protein